MSEAPATPVVTEAPPNEKTVWFEKKGSDGKTYSGNFTFKRLTIADTARLGAEIARLNGGFPVDQVTDLLHTMFASFRFAIKKAPDWWKLEELYDLDIVREVFEAQQAFEKTFRAPQG